MKRLIFSLFICALLLVLPSCATVPRDPLAYQKGSLTAEVVLEKNLTQVSAVIKLGPMTDAPRDAERKFSSGMSAVRKNGESSLTLGDTTLLTPDPKFFMLCDLFSLDGSIVSASTDRTTTQITLADGESSYEITLNRDGTPQRIIGDDFILLIVWIEFDK